MMPNLDFSNLPQNMRPGYAVGGPLMGRAANLSRQVLSRNAGRNLPDEAIPGIGDRIFGYVYNPRGSLPWTTSKFKTRYREFSYGRNRRNRSCCFGLDGTQN
jgi:hypothetical protein